MAKKTKKKRWAKDWPKASRPKVERTRGMNPIPSHPPPEPEPAPETEADIDVGDDDDEEIES